MKVIYKKSIVEQMNDAIDSAREQNEKIEKFELNKQEWDEFINRVSRWVSYNVEKDISTGVTYAGIAVECVN